MILEEKTMGERYSQRVNASSCFGPTKEARFSVLKLKGEERGLAVVWFEKGVVLIRLRSEAG